MYAAYQKQGLWHIQYQRIQLRKRLALALIFACVGAVILLAFNRDVAIAISRMPISGQLGLSGLQAVLFYIAWVLLGLAPFFFALHFLFKEE